MREFQYINLQPSHDSLGKIQGFFPLFWDDDPYPMELEILARKCQKLGFF